MSTDRAGKAVAEDLLADAKRLLEDARIEEQQLDLLEPISSEEMQLAQDALGPRAGRMAVLQQARASRRGRPKGARNKRSDDFAAYLSQFGPDPAVVLAQIVGTPEEVMVERSAAMDPAKRRMSFGDARAIRVRCAEALMPYYHGKVPVKIDATIRGVHIFEEIGGGARGVTVDNEPLGVLPFEDDEA